MTDALKPLSRKQRHIDQLAEWGRIHGFRPETGAIVQAFAAAMGDNQYGVEETWDAYCWFRNGYNAAGEKSLAPSETATIAAEQKKRGLTPEMVAEHYPQTQHQPDECEICHFVFKVAEEALK